MDEQQMMTVLQEMQRNQIVYLKLIEYMQADLDSKSNRIAQLEEQVLSGIPDAAGTDEP